MTTTGLDAIAADQGLEIHAQTSNGAADDRRIDEWELKAARRGLTNLRELLYGEPMVELLREQIEHADALHREYLAASAGQWTEGQVILTVKGLAVETFITFLRASLGAIDGTPEQVRQTADAMLFPSHPEHYGMPPYRGVIETMGGIPTRTRVGFIDNPPEFVAGLIDESYPIRLTGAGELEDGTPHTYVLQQLKDTEDGMEANLRIWYPAACPPHYVAEHVEHYAVEFRNGCRIAASGANPHRCASNTPSANRCGRGAPHER